jgi:hypothetical protein
LVGLTSNCGLIIGNDKGFFSIPENPGLLRGPINFMFYVQRGRDFFSGVLYSGPTMKMTIYLYVA